MFKDNIEALAVWIFPVHMEISYMIWNELLSFSVPSNYKSQPESSRVLITFVHCEAISLA